MNFLSLKKGALFEQGDLIEDLLYCICSTEEPFILPPCYYSLVDLSWQNAIHFFIGKLIHSFGC